MICSKCGARFGYNASMGWDYLDECFHAHKKRCDGILREVE